MVIPPAVTLSRNPTANQARREKNFLEDINAACYVLSATIQWGYRTAVKTALQDNLARLQNPYFILSSRELVRSLWVGGREEYQLHLKQQAIHTKISVWMNRICVSFAQTTQ
jgi:hypothetical protein